MTTKILLNIFSITVLCLVAWALWDATKHLRQNTIKILQETIKTQGSTIDLQKHTIKVLQEWIGALIETAELCRNTAKIRSTMEEEAVDPLDKANGMVEEMKRAYEKSREGTQKAISDYLYGVDIEKLIDETDERGEDK